MQTDTDLSDLRHGIETDVEQEEDYEARRKPRSTTASSMRKTTARRDASGLPSE